MTLVLQYKFDQTDLTVDSSSSGIDLVNAGGVVSAIDPTYGNVASFDASSNSYFTSGTSVSALQGSSPRTISYWMNRNAKGNFGITYTYGNTSTTGGGIRAAIGSNGVLAPAYGVGVSANTSTTLAAGTWYHLSEVYDGTDLTFYVNGVLDGSLTIAMNSTSDPLSLGRDVVHITSTNFIYTGYMSDFRVYDDSLTPAELLEIVSLGPNASLSVTMYTHLADLSWDVIPGATTYTITSNKNSEGEINVVDTSDTVFEVLDITPGASYEFRVYTDLDLVIPRYTTIEVAPIIETTSVETLMVRLQNDLTILSEDNSNSIEPFLRNFLTTNEIVKTSLGNTVFVANSDSIIIDKPEKKLLTPFDESAGSGQNVSVILPDTSISIVDYDDTTNEVISESISYPVGTYFVLGSLKVTVKEV